MSRLWIQDPLAIFAEGAARGVVIEGHQIAELIATGQKPLQPVDAIFDASDHVVLPGLINTHHHFYQTLTRALAPALGKELFDWLKALYPVWAGLDPELLAVATELALTELLLSGCTTTSDHHYLYPPGLEQALDIQVRVASHIGMRVTLTRGSMDLSQKDGGLPPDSVVQDAQTILADCERVVNTYHQSDPGAMVQVALAPCSPFSVSDPLMRESAALASRLGVRLHTHLGETRDENDYCLARLGMRPLDYLEECGWLGSHTWLAHGIHFTDDEIKRLGQAGTAVTHCPHSNMTLASGLCPTCALQNAGSPVGLGVDGSASNDASNAIEEVRAAL
ncbi:MAG: amidohydrolase family protein, partial [Arenicellales bacterium]|nr:amidohydrolase family protein [Arenicellales bacterium]